ncbi:uncharacterized protein METZ01_LOCUS71775 [marine metagenome]|uniref:AB hydrolase-1 domain-containing protein n=1 Tax=marine metagenome TaxID=408172 RepID=A0A381TTX6_9ZZZZ
MFIGSNCQESTLFRAAYELNVPFPKNIYPKSSFTYCGNRRFHYLEWGDQQNQPIVLLHGLGQQSHSWDLISLSLSDQYRVIAIDARGHGDTDWPEDSDYSPQSHVRDLVCLVNHLRLTDLIIIGHSMGGKTAYIYASEHPNSTKGLTIVDTGPESDTEGVRRIRHFISQPDKFSSFEEFAKHVQSYTGRPLHMVKGSLRHSVRQTQTGTWTWKYDKVIRNPNFYSEDWSSCRLWKALLQITCPTLVIRGENSDIFPNTTYQKMISSMPGATGKLVKNAGHLVQGDNPSGFLEALRPFLDSL